MVTAYIKKDVFRFEQMKKDTQEKIIQKRREIDNEFINDEVHGTLEGMLHESLLKSDNLKVRYDLSYSQGSGCCIDGGDLVMSTDNWESLLKELVKNTKYERRLKYLVYMFDNCFFTFNIYHDSNSRYVHENTMVISSDCRELKERHKHINTMLVRLENTLVFYARRLCQRMEKKGYEILESYNENHYTREFIDNKVVFDGYGNEITDDIDNVEDVQKLLY